MDKPSDASENAQERKGYSGGSSLGNGLSCGNLHPTGLNATPHLSQDGLWAPPTMAAKGRDPLGFRWKNEGTEGGWTEGEVRSELTLDQLLDMELQKMPTESHVTSACPHFPSSSSPGPNGVLLTGGNKRGVEGEMVDGVKAASQNWSFPFCQREEAGYGAGGKDSDSERREENASRTGHNGGEGTDREEQEQEGESKSRAGEGDRAAGAQGAPRRSGGGKRSRGRGSGSAGGPPCVREPPQPPVAPSSCKVATPAGSRHKHVRRRNHHHHQAKPAGRAVFRVARGCLLLLSESLCPWCLSCLRVVVELIVMVTHRCGEAVEQGGGALYDSGSRLLQKATDLPARRAEALALLAWARGGVRALAAGITQMAASCLGLALTLAGVLGKLSGERGRCWWAALQGSAVSRFVAGVWGKLRRTLFWRNHPQEQSPAPKSPGGAGRFCPEQELDRLLALTKVPEEELDPFAALGVEPTATEPELKRAYRQLAVLVSHCKRMAETELSKSMNEFLTKLQDDLKEAMNTMMCTRCEGKHRRFEMERDPSEARFCAECKRHHAAEEGDFWAESSMLGLRITYFAFIDGKVYDITEWAGCQRIGISPDTHRVPYHISFGSKNNGSATRHRTPPEPPPVPASPADLQDFFSRIFQGGTANGMAGATGSFFPSPPPPPHQSPGQGSATGGSFTAAPGPRRPYGDPAGARTEGPKPARRKKKVRRSFPR
ncbi:hypothetical protein JZ751_009292 [Albula glossodonta]|uniref:Cleavage inducing molecular chaperone Jiv domain-containing protein n=1 Tax=Albula glossodonta TaxID=121402 RepID=A0A8T2N254_9TELE|nr:hypothetical protein JZ751_009292 [Albula glossodonta]